MQSVWKYDVIIQDEIKIDMLVNSRILTVKTQNNKPKMWVLINLENKDTIETRTFIMKGTGHNITEEAGYFLEYINTFQVYDGKLVFHIFEKYKAIQ